jgi:hypothetical protein
MHVYIFRGTGRVFGFTENAAGTNLPEQFGPWASFKMVDMHREKPQPGVDTNECGGP